MRHGFDFHQDWTKYRLSCVFNSSNLSMGVKKISPLENLISDMTLYIPILRHDSLNKVNGRENIRLKWNERNNKINGRLTGINNNHIIIKSSITHCLYPLILFYIYKMQVAQTKWIFSSFRCHISYQYKVIDICKII